MKRRAMLILLLLVGDAIVQCRGSGNAEFVQVRDTHRLVVVQH